MKNTAQAEPSAWSLAGEAHTLGFSPHPGTKKAPPGVTDRAAPVPGWRLQPSPAAGTAGEPGWYPHSQGPLTQSFVWLASSSSVLYKSEYIVDLVCNLFTKCNFYCFYPSLFIFKNKDT